MQNQEKNATPDTQGDEEDGMADVCLTDRSVSGPSAATNNPQEIKSMMP